MSTAPWWWGIIIRAKSRSGSPVGGTSIPTSIRRMASSIIDMNVSAPAIPEPAWGGAAIFISWASACGGPRPSSTAIAVTAASAPATRMNPAASEGRDAGLWFTVGSESLGPELTTARRPCAPPPDLLVVRQPQPEGSGRIPVRRAGATRSSPKGRGPPGRARNIVDVDEGCPVDRAGRAADAGLYHGAASTLRQPGRLRLSVPRIPK